MIHLAPTTHPRLPGAGWLAAIAVGCAGLALNVAVATAQSITGTVAEAETGRQLAGARVSLMDMEGITRNQALTGENGAFSLVAPEPGQWVVTVDLFGFGSVRSEAIDVKGGEWIVLEVTMAAEAIPLDPVVVRARRSVGSPDIQRFYERRDRARRTGIGHFVARDEIERLSPNRPSDMLRSMAGVRVVRGAPGRGDGVRMAGGCIPAIYIDGMRINRVRIHDSIDDFVTVMDIEGIEVYRGPASQVANLHDPGGCGLILVWTRAGVHDPDSTLRWTTVLGALAGLILFLVVMN